MTIRGWTAGVLTALSASLAACVTPPQKPLEQGPYKSIKDNGCSSVVGPNDDPERVPCQPSITLN